MILVLPRGNLGIVAPGLQSLQLGEKDGKMVIRKRCPKIFIFVFEFDMHQGVR